MQNRILHRSFSALKANIHLRHIPRKCTYAKLKIKVHIFVQIIVFKTIFDSKTLNIYV